MQSNGLKTISFKFLRIHMEKHVLIEPKMKGKRVLIIGNYSIKILQFATFEVTGFEPMALCTQNRCADQTALHLVSPPSAYRSTRSMKTRTELAHPFGHRDARTNPSNQPLFLENLPPASHPNPTAKKPYSAGALTFWLPLSFTFIFENPARSRLPVLWTQSPLRSGFEPLTQGFSVLCSNQLSYLNHFPKVCFLHRIAPYLTYHFTS